MINPLWLYLINVSDVLNNTLTGFGVIFIFIVIVILILKIFSFDFENYSEKTINKMLKIFGVIGVICMFGSAILPPKETGYLMLTSYYLDTETLKSGLILIQETAKQLMSQ